MITFQNIITKWSLSRTSAMFPWGQKTNVEILFKRLYDLTVVCSILSITRRKYPEKYSSLNISK